jgi:hypothetical protein
VRPTIFHPCDLDGNAPASSFYSHIISNSKELVHRTRTTQRNYKLRRDTIEFVVTFSFKNEILEIYTTLKVVRDNIFEEPEFEIFPTYHKKTRQQIMPFGLKNAPAIFSRVVVVTFKDFIHKFLEV